MINNEILASFGLNETESAIYLAALELGESLPKHLAEKASVKRPMLYKVLPSLFEKGLLSQTVKGKRRYLVAEDPEILVEEKQSELKRLEEKLPELRLLLRTATSKPKIVFYEGIEGLKKLYMDNLRERQPILEFVSLENIHPEIESHSKNYYIPARINRNIPIKIIVSGETESKSIRLKTDPYALREVKTISQEKFPIPLDCYIYGDNVSFAVYRTDSEPIGVIIRSKEISRTLRSLFEFVWEKAKQNYSK
jgi:HTH-type transcriptional regulator, sugar sensing transcriptional regulator